MDQERIFKIVQANALKVLPDVNAAQVTIDTTLTDLGANSVDRVEIVMYSMQDLGLKIPRGELQGIGNLRGLVELLFRHANPPLPG
jgi:polyketide biosynthesis acyl carrier protein